MVILSTGPSGIVCNNAGYPVLARGERALDAVQAGLMAAEMNPLCDDIGYGGRPDANGVMSLDAALMDGPTHRAGAVAALKGILHPVAVARRVMDVTPHVLLVGEGAKAFALTQGFEDLGSLLTPESAHAYDQFLRGERRATFTGELPPTVAAIPTTDKSHDTIGCCALDASGNLAAGTSTSGLDFKLPGRVGDSPIIGSGLYVENSVGAAACFGMGEQMLQICMAFRVVAAMGRGSSPQDACREGIEFLWQKRPGIADMRCCCVALSRTGDTGGAATSDDFYYNVTTNNDGEAGRTVSVPALHIPA